MQGNGFNVVEDTESEVLYYLAPRHPSPFSRFFNDLKDMLGFRPFRFYYYMWKFITPILLLVLLCSSFIQLIKTPPSYSAWIKDKVSRRRGPGRLEPVERREFKVTWVCSAEKEQGWGLGGRSFQPADNQQDVLVGDSDKCFDVKRERKAPVSLVQLIGCCGQWPPP